MNKKKYTETVFTLFSAFSSPISWTASISILLKQKPHETEKKKYSDIVFLDQKI